MATMSISLPDGLKRWAQQKAQDGDFSTPSDYIRSLIRADKERARGDLEAMLLDGLDSGEGLADTPATRQALRREARAMTHRKGGRVVTK